jgi:hypothetical protein
VSEISVVVGCMNENLCRSHKFLGGDLNEGKETPIDSLSGSEFRRPSQPSGSRNLETDTQRLGRREDPRDRG